MRAKPKIKSVLEKFLFPNASWQDGYKTFSKAFGIPISWIYVLGDEDGDHLVRLDRKGGLSDYHASDSLSLSLESFHLKYGEQIARDPDVLKRLPVFYKDVAGKSGVIFGMAHLGKIKALFFLGGISKHEKQVKDWIKPFDAFLTTHVELAYKTFELNNFYETVHPRALALSTMHSVHRVISSSLRLTELLPRIGRLSAQVLKARGCSIMLVDPTRDYLLPYFSFGENSKMIHRQRVKIGRGVAGHIASTGEFHLTRQSIGVPFIEDDVVGVLLLWDKIDRQAFTKTDLEILKSLSEQAVVAIKNAQLYEETEQLTLGSIQTINELLELNLEEKRKQDPVVGETIIEIGKEMGLSGKELTHLSRAVLLLDTGTLALPKKIWRKKGRLTKKEFEEIKRIPLKGASILRSISSLKPAIPIILHQRERYDGKGYPLKLKGEEIPVGARIVSVVDSFVAMISERSYRSTMSFDEGVAEIEKHSGTQFDPQVVSCFLRVIHRKDIDEKLRALAGRHALSS